MMAGGHVFAQTQHEAWIDALRDKLRGLRLAAQSDFTKDELEAIILAETANV